MAWWRNNTVPLSGSLTLPNATQFQAPRPFKPGGVVYTSTACGPQIYPQHPPPPERTYFIALPEFPKQGDHITLTFINGGWFEERAVNSEINPKVNNTGAFSLDELTEARKLIMELS